MQEFEWSESGLNLLNIIKRIIGNNGGLDPYYQKVFKEVYPEGTYKADKEREKAVFELTQKYGVKRADACVLLNINYWEYQQFLEKMRNEKPNK